MRIKALRDTETACFRGTAIKGTTHMKDSFIIYKSFYEPIKALSDKQLGRLFRAIFDYQIDNSTQVGPDIQMAFAFFKNQMDIDEGRYQMVVERNKLNGSKGGRPNKEENPQKPVGLKTPKKADNDYISPLSTNVDIPPLTKSDDKKHSSECLNSESVEDRSLSSDTPPPAVKTQDETDFDNFKVWLRKNAANVAKMKEPFTMDEYLRIRKQYDPATVKEILLAMHNWKELNSKKISANLTFRRWAQKEQIKHS